MKVKRSSLLISFLLLLSNQTFFSAVGITAPSLAITTCTFSSAYNNLGNIIIDEGTNGDFAVAAGATLILTIPANFQFNPGVGTLTQNGGAVNLSALAIVVTSTTITITYTSGGTNRDDILTISGIQVRAITSASSGNILRTAGNPGTGTITGITNGTTSFGALSSAVGCSCTHTVRLTDTFGDGWNGGIVKVQVNGVDVLTNLGPTFTTGSGPIDFTFNAATGDVIRVIETAAGSFEGEMRVEVLDIAGGIIIASHNPVTGAGTSGTGNCPPPMVLTASTVTQASTASVSKCDVNQQIICLEITTTGAASPLTLTQIQTNVSGTAGVTALSGADIYYTGTSNSFTTNTLFGSNASPSTSTYNINGSQTLASGTNYFWLVYDLNNTGTLATTIDGLITQFTASATNYNSGSTPAITATNPAGNRSLIVCVTPGGVTGSSLWLKSNASTNTTTNNALVSSWGSQVSPAVTVTQGTASLQPTFKDGSGTTTNNRFNYNPFIYTDGTSNRLVQTGDINLGNTTTGFSVYQVIGEDNGIVAMDWYHTGNGSIKVKGDALMYINNADGSSQQNAFSSNGSQTVEAFLQSVRGVPGAISGNGKFNGVAGASYNDGWRVASQNGLCIGSNLDNSEFMQGGMGEFIIFPSILNATQNLQVESYLAIKYGITLGTSASVSNYLASDATQIWVGNALYQNKIIGIGRDDASLLLQKQSHNYDDTVRIYKGTLATTNIGNSSTFAVDKSFVVSGANTGKMYSTTASKAEVPTGLTNCTLTSRLEREWRITKTNFAEDFNMDFKLQAAAQPTSVNIAHLRFLVDDDGNFANGGTQCYYNGDGTGIVISYSNPVITVSNISNTHIGNNLTKYVTIASINPATPLPIELLFFDANLNNKKAVDLTWETSAERDNDYFTIDKSVDGLNWVNLGIVDGAGTTSIPQSYYLEDFNPVLGLNYYRLKQTDFNGEFTYADIRTINLKNQDEYFLYPNPSDKSVNIYGLNSETDQINILDNLGKNIYFETNIISKNQIEVSTSNFANGIYYVKISTNLNQYTLKLTVFNK